MSSLRVKAHFSMSSRKLTSRQRQGGIATILIMLLVGLSLTATVLGVMYYIRGTQSQLVSVHAQTQAQMRAWTGADALGKFLTELHKADALKKTETLKALAAQVSTAPTNISISTGTGSSAAGLPGVSAKFISVDSATNPTVFTAEITGIAVETSQAKSQSILNVVYKLAGSGSSTKAPKLSGLTFNRNLRMGGGISVITETGSPGFEINVMGDFSTSGNSITGVSKINSTGTISIGSSSTFGELNADCDVNLTGSVTAGTINARRNVCLTGTAAGTTAINANGSVTAKSSSKQQGDIAAIGKPTGVESCSASGTNENANNSIAEACPIPNPGFTVELLGGGGSAKSVKANGNVSMDNGAIGDLQADGDLSSGHGAIVNSATHLGSIGGTITALGKKEDIHVTESTTGLTVTIPAVAPVSIEEPPIINAYDYESIANYAFKVDTSGYKKVTVKNVSGIADGTYYLGDYAEGGRRDYLCAELDDKESTPGSATAPGTAKCKGTYSSTSSPPKIGKGQSDYNNCFSITYLKNQKDPSDNGWRWSFDGNSIAQGTVWFEGNLSVGSGTYYNTMIATRNIYTSASNKIYAPNWAGYSGTVGSTEYAPTGICQNANFPTIYPTQFCGNPKKPYEFNQAADNGIGNYVLIAGSIPPGTKYNKGTKDTNGDYVGGNYVGGNISPGASTEFFGSLMAGNEFTGSGSFTIHGYMTALASGSITNNQFSGSTTVKLTGLPDTLTISAVPSPPCTTNCGAATTTSEWKILWSRYL